MTPQEALTALQEFHTLCMNYVYNVGENVDFRQVLQPDVLMRAEEALKVLETAIADEPRKGQRSGIDAVDAEEQAHQDWSNDE